VLRNRFEQEDLTFFFLITIRILSHTLSVWLFPHLGCKVIAKSLKVLAIKHFHLCHHQYRCHVMVSLFELTRNAAD
jgi:hypothetical protein